jgi:26S proteasome regulatory subunit N10
VLVTPTQDEGKVVAALHDVKLAGDSDLTTGIQVAQVRRHARRASHQALKPPSSP